MAVFKCKFCGAPLEIKDNQSVVTCENCGLQQTLPKLDDDRRVNLYDHANHFRRNNDFDKAMSIYERILNEDKCDAEAYWSLVLCRYGIEYVKDPTTRKRIPTVHRAQYTSVAADDDYKSALENADAGQRLIYIAEAKQIDEIQKGILAISKKEKPFDVFICYKETDIKGRRTPDSVLASNIYHRLTQEGFKVFFARITLEDKLGSAYEPYIFAALNSAKVMVALGTKSEYFNAVWVKNEWSRYLKLIRAGAEKVLIPAYRDMDPYDLPEEFFHLQAKDMSKLSFMQDLICDIKKLIAPSNPAPTKAPVVQSVSAGSTNTAALLEREQGETQERDAAAEAAEKKRKKTTTVIMIVIVTIAALVAGYMLMLKPAMEKSSRYNSAQKLYSEGKYDEAYEIYTTLSGYKDVDRLIEEDEDLLAAAVAADAHAAYIAQFEVGNTVTFGSYAGEDIEWLVLEANGDERIMISTKGLEAKTYNTEYTSVTWEACTLRKWLNGEFLNAAFNAEEQAMLETVTVTADENPKYSTNPGNDTQDKVWLLSITEAERYFSSDEERICKPTQHAKDNGAYVNSNIGGCWLWLRSPGSSGSYAASVDADGNVNFYGYRVDYNDGCVRPVVSLRLS